MKKVEEKFDSQSMFKELSVKFGSGSHMELNEEYTQVEERVLKGLVGLRLLKNVPFRYLIPHEDLLPNESIRFFFVDRNWLDALVDGALSVGRIGTRDYAYDERKYDSGIFFHVFINGH